MRALQPTAELQHPTAPTGPAIPRTNEYSGISLKALVERGLELAASEVEREQGKRRKR